MADRKALRATAKTLYVAGRETIKQIAAEIGVSRRTVERWSAVDGWERIKSTHKLSERAHRIASKLSEIPENSKQEEREKALKAVTEQLAVDERADVLVRHRREWQVSRVLMSEAVRERSTEKAKMAKMIAETTSIMQKGERLAWGLDTDVNTRVQVIIERS